MIMIFVSLVFPVLTIYLSQSSPVMMIIMFFFLLVFMVFPVLTIYLSQSSLDIILGMIFIFWVSFIMGIFLSFFEMFFLVSFAKGSFNLGLFLQLLFFFF